MGEIKPALAASETHLFCFVLFRFWSKTLYKQSISAKTIICQQSKVESLHPWFSFLTLNLVKVIVIFIQLQMATSTEETLQKIRSKYV